MKINEQKTKYMIAAGSGIILYARKIVAFGDKNFEVKERYGFGDAAKNLNCK
jgi:hypothetical protein